MGEKEQSGKAAQVQRYTEAGYQILSGKLLWAAIIFYLISLFFFTAVGNEEYMFVWLVVYFILIIAADILYKKVWHKKMKLYGVTLHPEVLKIRRLTGTSELPYETIFANAGDRVVLTLWGLKIKAGGRKVFFPFEIGDAQKQEQNLAAYESVRVKTDGRLPEVTKDLLVSADRVYFYRKNRRSKTVLLRMVLLVQFIGGIILEHLLFMTGCMAVQFFCLFGIFRYSVMQDRETDVLKKKISRHPGLSFNIRKASVFRFFISGCLAVLADILMLVYLRYAA